MMVKMRQGDREREPSAMDDLREVGGEVGELGAAEQDPDEGDAPSRPVPTAVGEDQEQGWW